MNRTRTALAAVIVAGVLCTGLGAWAALPSKPVVHASDAEIRFGRKCANADPHRVQAHAWFRAAERRALVLGNVYARRDPTRREEVFIGVLLVGMRLDGGPDWADAPFSIRLEAIAGERRWSGPGVGVITATRGLAVRPRASVRTPWVA